MIISKNAHIESDNNGKARIDITNADYTGVMAVATISSLPTYVVLRNNGGVELLQFENEQEAESWFAHYALCKIYRVTENQLERMG